MRAIVVTALLGLAIGTTALAQSTNTAENVAGASPTTNTISSELTTPLSLTPVLELGAPRVKTTGALRPRGPLVESLSAPARLLYLFNPFAPAPPKTAILKSGKLNSRSWTATVGWTPARSAFADVNGHDTGGVELVTLSR